jgi:hypothetical protein
VYTKNSVTVDVTERLDVGAGRFEDPEAEKAEHRDQLESARGHRR